MTSNFESTFWGKGKSTVFRKVNCTFSNSEKSIYTYDKISCKAYNATLSSVCFENDLYTLSYEYVKKSREEKKGVVNNLTIEHDHFSRDVEPLYSQMRKPPINDFY